MTSKIISTGIDEAYPVAGIDNDTQGFRDNFAIIKNNFAAAKSEIEELQETTAKLDRSNNFKGSKLIDANLEGVTEEYFPIGGLSPLQTGINIDFRNGHYQTLVVDEFDLTINLVGWPDQTPGTTPQTQETQRSRLAKFTVELRGAGNSAGEPRTITWTTRGGGVGTSFKTRTNFPNPFTVDTQNTVSEIVEFWSYDSGQTVYANYLGRFQ
jgi:hypothetical protein